MKKLYHLLAIFIVLFAGCTRKAHPVDPDRLLISFVERQQLLERLLLRKGEGEDLSLFLYRNPLTRKVVVDFYLEVTEDAKIALPILTFADKYEIPLPLAFSLAWVESSFDATATNINSRSVDRGLFQLNSRTFPALKEGEFYDPHTNARYGLGHLRYCLNVGGNEIVALAMYNAGTHGVTQGTPYSTLHYVARIVGYRNQLEQQFESRLFQADNLVRLSRLSGYF